MSNKFNIKLDNKPNKISILVDNFVKKILLIEKESSTLENKVNHINNLLDNLIDYCIKKKIYFYIEKKIRYTQIIYIFKLHLCKFLQKLIDPSNNIINKYIEKLESNENFDNYSDINSLLFRKFKTESESESKSKHNEYSSSNKNVSFREDISIIGYDDSEGFDLNYSLVNKSRKKLDTNDSSKSTDSSDSSKSSKSSKSSNSDTNNSEELDENSNTLDTDRLALYIKILLSQNKYIIEFIDRLRNMCVFISEQGIDLEKSNPFN
jgi:hypothetical protein